MTGQSPLEPHTDEPATVSDVRALRRWVAVAAIWAVAASVIAVVALLEEEPPPPAEPALDLSTRIGQIERRIERRIERLEERAREAAASEDVERLDGRLKRAEGDADDALRGARDVNEAVAKLAERLAALEDRVEELESQPGGGETP